MGLVVALGVLAAACGSSGNPESFTDQPGELPDSIAGFASDLLGPSGDPTMVPLVQRNFLEGCMIDDALRMEGLQGSSRASACGCSYDALVTDLQANPAGDQTPFETFVAIDRSLRTEGEAIGSRYADLFAACRADAS